MSKAAIVTGASKGIGYACAARLGSAGYSVLICARNSEQIERAAEELGEGGAKVVGLAADVGDPTQCEAIVQRCVDEFGRVDALVNNAGIWVPCDFLEITAERWDETLDIDLRGPVLLSVAAAKRMRDQGGGRIVHISSTAALAAQADLAAYSAAKAGLVSLTQSMAVDLARYGIVTNCVAPGWTRTPLSEEYIEVLSDEEIAKFIPLGRVVESSEVAEVVAFLCSQDVKAALGQTICVDGGMLSREPSP
jgi:NAD(P)-dependent dehydrogenase (short-subunit alcohol dehydrogenase family)